MGFTGWADVKVPDWDQAFGEYEDGEKSKSDKLNNERDRKQRAEKKLLDD